jgi:hypothetical protein
VADIGRRNDAPDAILDIADVSDTQREDIAEVPPTRVPGETALVPKEIPRTVVEIEPVTAWVIKCLSFCDTTEGESYERANERSATTSL